MVDHPRMTPEQTTALDRAIELIGEFFDYGGMFCNGELEAGDEEEESDDGDDWKKEKA